MKFANWHISCFFILILNLMVAQPSTDQIGFRELTVEQGLSQNSVVSIAQDSTGYLWFATQDGLNRYNGKNFDYYNLQFVDITRPDYSKLGKVYVGNDGSIFCTNIDGNLLKYSSTEDDFFKASNIRDVSTILQDSDGDIFLGTFGNGLYHIEKNSQDTIQLFSSRQVYPDIFNLREFNKSIFIAASGGLYIYSEGQVKAVVENVDSDINFSSFSFLKGKGLFVGSYGKGLLLYDENSEKLNAFRGFQDEELIPEDLNIQDLLTDQHNRLWIATYGQGVYLIDFKNEKIAHFMADPTNPFAIRYNDVLCMLKDATNNIWLGTDGAGLSYYDEHLIKFRMLSNDQLPADVNVDVIRSITTDKDGNMWLGTSGKGLTLANPDTKQFKTFTTRNSPLNTNRIMSLLYLEEELWIGHQAGGLQIRNMAGRFRSITEFDGYTIWKIISGKDNSVWLCTRENGLIEYDKNRGVLRTFNSDNSNLTTNNIRTIDKQDDSNFWIGTEDNGLFLLNLGDNSITVIEGSPTKIKSLYFEAPYLWIGTNGNGLVRYNTLTGEQESYTTENGLFNNVVYGVLGDEQGNKWLSTNKGIVRVNLEQPEKQYFVNFSPVNGLQAFEFNTGAYHKDENGHIYFGGLKGVNWFRPEALSFNEIKPKTVISKMEVFEEERPTIPGLKLKHNENTVSFSFAALHYSQPQENLYRYKLENHDDDWSFPDNANTAHYTNLPPDDYTFKVMSSNYEGVWNKEPVAYSFTILQPWYATNMAKVIYVILALLTIFLVYNYFKWRWAVRMQLQLEQAEAARLKKLDDYKSKLYTDISHEFRTPLTLIDGPVKNQLRRNDLSIEDKEELELIKRNSNRLMNLVNQLLDLARLESGNLKLSVINDDVGSLLDQMAKAFRFKAEEKNIAFKSDIPKIKNAWFDRDVVEKIVTNLLSNAIKYTPSGGMISYSAQPIDGQVIITVINSGNTLKDTELPRLFQRFYQDKSYSDGMGVGLSLVKELCILSHGNVVANTLDADKIQFTVTLPIDKSFYHHTEIDFESVELKMSSEDPEIEESEKPVVLIIDDDKDMRQYIRSILAPDYEIREAAEGKSGLSMAIDLVPDIIICDVMMPGPDGLETTNAIKNDLRSSHVPVILLTAKTGDKHEIRGFETGADAYMTKPFSPEKLKIRIENLISGRKQLQSHFGNNFEFKTRDIQISSAEEEFQIRLQEVLDDNLTNPDFNAEDFSKKMLMSRMQLHRKLKALTDMSTSEFIRMQRLKQAIAIMKSNNCTVSEVAYQVGFNTPSYFIKSFKSVYECTPAEFMDKQA